jgi:hypothetical protein
MKPIPVSSFPLVLPLLISHNMRIYENRLIAMEGDTCSPPSHTTEDIQEYG